MGGIISRKRAEPGVSLAGKVCIVTGANIGIGFEIARDFVSRGAHVVLACRSRERGEAAAKKIKEEGEAAKGGPWTGTTEFAALDLESFASVRSFAKSFENSGRPCHVLVCNAGLVLNEERITNDGFEAIFQVNYLGHFLLTALLLDTLRRSGTPESPARIVNQSSCMHRNVLRSHEDFEVYARRRPPGAVNRYGASKLMQVLSTRALARRLEGSNVTVNACHPGAVLSDIWRFMKGPLGSVTRAAMSLVFMDNREGAQNSIFLAVSPSLARKSGGYYNPNPYFELLATIVPYYRGYVGSYELKPSPLACDDALAERLLAKSLEWTGVDESTIGSKKKE